MSYYARKRKKFKRINNRKKMSRFMMFMCSPFLTNSLLIIIFSLVVFGIIYVLWPREYPDVEFTNYEINTYPIEPSFPEEEIEEQKRIIKEYFNEQESTEETEAIVEESLGKNVIDLPSQEIVDDELVKLDLPDKYYSNIDYSSFQPYMDYHCITNKATPAYHVCYADEAYTDELGFRRYKTSDDQFTIDGQDDYVVALGTYYKEKGEAGQRYLVVTTTGMFTMIAGSEKDDQHTDSHNMFTIHNGDKAGVIEWIVDDDEIEDAVSRLGTMTGSSFAPLHGDILYIYRIL